MVDSVMIDTSYDGQTFEIAIADIPERKTDLAAGAYEFDMPSDSTAVAVSITDMLGEEVLVVEPSDHPSGLDPPTAARSSGPLG